MKVAVMQPYFFPYLGYFKLISAVDLFVFLDDVQYIRRGWVNRNKISRPDRKSLMYVTVPVVKSKRDTKINQMQVLPGWVDDHIKSFEHVYGKKIIENDFYQMYLSLDQYSNLCRMLCDSIVWTSKKLNINTRFDFSSKYPSDKTGESRIVELCKLLSATQYFNLPGGKTLYHEELFAECKIELHFVDTSEYEKLSVIEGLFDGSANFVRF